MPQRPPLGACLVLTATLQLVAVAAHGAELLDLSLEQLREVVVTTVSRRSESLQDAAASVYVITREEIRRSGATTLPEALRLAPQLDVARADANQYAISARGFDSTTANHLLVMIDGRTVYTPLYSGVFWEAQDVMLEDVERIEVISGPGSALWGTNAVNGLIHVITRSAADTLGAGAMLHAGDRERGAAARAGWRLNEDTALRLYAKSYDRSATRDAAGASVVDGADGVQAGFRADWRREGESLTLQGDAYRGEIDQPGSTGGRHFAGANLTGRWQRSLASGGQLTLQLYADHTERVHPFLFNERLDTLDSVAQYAFHAGQSHQLVVGAGYRSADDRTGHGSTLAFLPDSRRLAWARVFAQDQIALGEHTELGLSASAEHNPYTGTELLPSVRLAHRVGAGTWWGSLSRAVRAPSRIDRDLVTPAQPPYLFAGGPQFRSEVSNVAELGYRGQPLPELSYSATLFHHQHQRLRSVAPSPAGLVFSNDIEGHTSGLEAWASWRAAERWRLVAGGVLLHQSLHVRAGAVDLGGLAVLGNDPAHWWQLRSSFDIAPRLAWDVGVRGTGSRPSPAVPSYTTLDTRLAWTPRQDLELSLVLGNAADRPHTEWGVAPQRPEFRRAASLQLRWGL